MQTKRILYIIPNFRAVSADQHLPPQTVQEKFKTATLDSVDYSSFIFVAYRPESPRHAMPRRSSIKAPRATEGITGTPMPTMLTRICGSSLFSPQLFTRIRDTTRWAMAVLPSGSHILSHASQSLEPTAAIGLQCLRNIRRGGGLRHLCLLLSQSGALFLQHLSTLDDKSSDRWGIFPL